MTEGVKTLLGDPKKAIIKLALPMVVAMSLTAMYNFVDRLWVSGLGEDALSATGYYMPFMFFAMAVATGLGVGGGALVSRRIGAKDKKGAESAALHTILFSLIASVIFTAPFMLFAPQIFMLMGAKSSLPQAVDYGVIMFGGTIFLFFTNIANALLRSEGNAKKVMYAMLLGTVLNIGLDPLMIYAFGWGVSGAAIATVISMAISSVLLFYWLFVEKKSYLAFDPRGFKFDGGTSAEIFKIGIPTILGQGSMSVMMLAITVMLTDLASERAVGVFTAGWTIVQFAILPLLGIGTAVVSVAAAAYGSREIHKIRTVHNFSFSIGIVAEIAIAAFCFFGAPLIAFAFTWSPETASLAPDLEKFFRIIWLYFPASAGGVISQSVFQGMRMAFRGLVITVMRTIVFALAFAWLFGYVLGWGEQGVYWGLVCSTWISSTAAFFWARISIGVLQKRPDLLQAKEVVTLSIGMLHLSEK